MLVYVTQNTMNTMCHIRHIAVYVQMYRNIKKLRVSLYKIQDWRAISFRHFVEKLNVIKCESSISVHSCQNRLVFACFNLLHIPFLLIN